MKSIKAIIAFAPLVFVGTALAGNSHACPNPSEVLSAYKKAGYHMGNHLSQKGVTYFVSDYGSSRSERKADMNSGNFTFTKVVIGSDNAAYCSYQKNNTILGARAQGFAKPNGWEKECKNGIEACTFEVN